VSFYLTFDQASNGSLFTHWSQTPVPDALCKYTPTNEVAKFKYTQNGGRNELIRTMNGPNVQRFYLGWVQFFKAAKENDAEVVVLLGEKAPAPLAVYIVNKDTSVSRVQENTPFKLDNVGAIAAVNPSVSVYGVQKMNVALFREHADAAKGAAIQF